MKNLTTFGLDNLVDILKAAAEPTRLRLLALLAEGDLTVSDLTEILGQSQPRISRHLKLLAEAGIVDRYQEGAWAYFGFRRDAGAARAEKTAPRDADGLVGGRSCAGFQARVAPGARRSGWCLLVFHGCLLL